MNPSIADAKDRLRARIRAELARISPAVRAVESIDLCRRLKPQLASAQTILFFAPLPDELDVWPLLEELLLAGKTCALPSFDRDHSIYRARQVADLAKDIVAGPFGIREPVPAGIEIPLDRFDLMLVPGLAFDRQGHRLGRGRGFYDRLLEKTSGVKCGIGYDHQVLEEIPTEPHDVPMDFMVTPARCLRRKSTA
jgi:5-formyltetrahydrofolate cyclo-ligase